MQKLLVIMGPTASGKSDLAVSLAKKINGEIISADSRQVYKGLDIGTGKITKKEMCGVPHHLLDVVSPKKIFTASSFKKFAEKKVGEIAKRGRLPIICGGTGFYIDALLGDKQIPEVPPNLELRKKLEKKSVEELFKILQKLDPERATNIDAKNPRRLVRAIEIAKAIGKTPRYEARDKKYDAFKIGVAPITPSPTPSSYNKRKGLPAPSLVVREGGVSYFLDEKELRKKINKRIEKWFKQGLLKEVQNLHNPPAGGGLSWKRMSEIGLEYKLVAEYLKSKNSNLKSLKKEMSGKTWQYAKRQITWFKKDKGIVWSRLGNVKFIQKEVEKFLAN